MLRRSWLKRRSRRTGLKYNNISSKCGQGHYHASKLEAGYCNNLELLRRSGAIQSYEWNRRWELRIDSNLITVHYPDFTVTTEDGKTEIHETKGVETDTWRIKYKLFKALYPTIPYYVIK